MKYDYDLICIGLGSVGMAVSVMGSSMGLRVCAIEKSKIGGECMNVGCIPSKSLLSMAKARHVFTKLAEMELASVPAPDVLRPFEKIAGHLKFINENKTRKMFDKVDLHLGEGAARFIDDHTVAAGRKMDMSSLALEKAGVEVNQRGTKYMTVEMPYEDFGATVAESVSTGFIKVFCSKMGRIYGVCIVGEGSGNMINEWALAIQKKIRIHDIMMLQHSFPTMGFMSKMVSERWMMKLMDSKRLQSICRFMFRL